jgi:hypothetical protein
VAWDWNQVLTAGVTSAIVSSAVSFLTSQMRLRFDTIKERRAEFFPQFIKLREQLKIENAVFPASGWNILMPSPDLDQFYKEVALFDEYKFYLTRKERVKIETLRLQFTREQIKTATREPNSPGSDIPSYTMPTGVVTESMKKVMSDFMTSLRSAVEAQLTAIQI